MVALLEMGCVAPRVLVCETGTTIFNGEQAQNPRIQPWDTRCKLDSLPNRHNS